MSYLLDTNICIGLLKHKKKLMEHLQIYSPDELLICSIVKAELLYGAHNSQQINRNLNVLRKFFDQFQSLIFDDQAAEYYGSVLASLKKWGTPIGINDLMIACIALAHQSTVITRNISEFQRVPGLKYITF